MRRFRLASMAGLVLLAALPSPGRAESEMHQSPLLEREFDPPVADARPRQGSETVLPSRSRGAPSRHGRRSLR